ncbi:MAG: AbrB/MazE/SpoVT family DNA-binding domain-containing protein [Candidatus Latescibacteria bacterium]|nr:AbrB/MazE/SpoVT family DNA-binding domain-containing protein [Candidatus Latescibacterota bacterium]
MQAIKYVTTVNTHGQIVLPRVRLKKGTPVEVIVLMREPGDEYIDLLEASKSSLAFWDNPIDDEVWNDA